MRRKIIKGKNMIIRLERLYKGFICDLRSFEYDEAVKKGLNVKFYVEPTGRWVTITNEGLSEGLHDSFIHKSKLKKPPKGQERYHLVLFSVTPDSVKEAERKEKEKDQQGTMEDYMNHANRMLQIRAQLKDKLKVVNRT